ncbi:MAG: hypothetical protein RL075_1232 [Pseudomonadota bacterium]
MVAVISAAVALPVVGKEQAMPAPLNTLLRHFWLDADDTRSVIGTSLLERLTQQVAASEQSHSGEICICVEASLPWRQLWRVGPAFGLADAVRARAVEMFSQLRVWDTANNNGVLIYVLLAEHAIEVVADRGLSAHVPAAHWAALVARMGEAFKQGDYEAGLSAALTDITGQLVQHFALPADADLLGASVNPNELPDTPTML